MSTRGVVAIYRDGTWEGRYNHSSSYPTYLGQNVFETARRYLREDGDLERFATTLLSRTDWREMESDGICAYCGKAGLGQPHSISGLIAYRSAEGLPASKEAIEAELTAMRKPWELTVKVKREIARNARWQWQMAENIRKTGFPDPKGKFHSHEPFEDCVITPENAGYASLAWGYVIRPETREMFVLKGGVKSPYTCTQVIIRPDGRRTSNEHSDVTFAQVCVVDLRGDEPDWAAVEKAGYASRERDEQYLAAHPEDPRCVYLAALPKETVIDQRTPALEEDPPLNLKAPALLDVPTAKAPIAAIQSDGSVRRTVRARGADPGEAKDDGVVRRSRRIVRAMDALGLFDDEEAGT